MHGSPLKADDARAVKKKFGFDAAKSFEVPQKVYDLYHQTAARGAAAEEEWKGRLEEYKKKFPKEGAELERRLKGELPEGWEKHLPTYFPDFLYRCPDTDRILNL